MTNDISLLKARYCRAIVKTASIATDEEARRLIQTLTTERVTADVSPEVEQAERTALAAVAVLAERLSNRNLTHSSMEWTKTQQAIESWILSAQ